MAKFRLVSIKSSTRPYFLTAAAVGMENGLNALRNNVFGRPAKDLLKPSCHTVQYPVEGQCIVLQPCQRRPEPRQFEWTFQVPVNPLCGGLTPPTPVWFVAGPADMLKTQLCGR